MIHRALALAIVCCGLVSASCAHRRGYELGEFHLEWGDDHSFLVWDAAAPHCCMPMVPVVQVKASKVSTAQGPCFDGLYNPRRLPLESGDVPLTVQLFLLCPAASAETDRGAFRIVLRTPSGDQHLAFSVLKSAPGVSYLAPGAGQFLGRVLLPEGDLPFRRHPELLGALFAIGVVPARETQYRLER
jgi:hypothetical protein